MSGFGMGLGSFLDGMTKGAALGNQMQQQSISNDLNERRMKLTEGQDARSAQSDAQNLLQGKTIFDNAQSDRTANAPILEATRSAQLGGLQDAAALRDLTQKATDAANNDYSTRKAASIKQTTGADGKPAWSVDGEAAASAEDADSIFERKNGSAADNWAKDVVPKIVLGHLKNGDIAGAKLLQNFTDQNGVQNAMKDYGRMSQALHMGDYDAATKYFNSMASNGDYINQDRHNIRLEQVKGEDGKPTGAMRMTYKDKVGGNAHTQDFTNMDEFNNLAITMAAPENALKLAQDDLAAQRASKAAKATANQKLAGDITLEGVKNQGQMDIKRLEGANAIATELAKGTSDKNALQEKINLWKSMNEGNGTPFMKDDGTGKKVDMTPAEQAALVDTTYQGLRGTQGGALGAMPQQQVPTAATPTTRPNLPQSNQTTRVPASRSLKNWFNAGTFTQFGPPDGQSADEQPPAAQKSISTFASDLAARNAQLAASRKSAADAERNRPLTVDEQYAVKRGYPKEMTPDEVDASERIKASQSYWQPFFPDTGKTYPR